VEILDLARGSIKFVDQLFAGMTSNAVNTKLRVLDLSSNKLTSLKANAFSRLVGLARLDLRANEIELLENGAFSGLVNLQELNFSFHDRAMKPLDLAVFGDEPDLANLRFINLSDSNDKRVDSIVSSVDPSKLFAHYRHRVVVQATRLILQAQGAYKLFDGLLQNGHIFLTVPYRSTLQRARLILD
jgi:Leucine-rich repeat (LRR) protein